MESPITDIDVARAKLVVRRETIRQRRRIGLLIGGILAFVFGGFPALLLAFTVVAIARAVERSHFRR